MISAANKVNIFRSSSGSPTVLISSNSTLATTSGAGGQESFTMAISPAAVTISSTRNAATRRLSTRARPTPWLRAEASRSDAPAPALRPEEEPSEAASPDQNEPIVAAVSVEPPKPPLKTSKIELTIESLQNYDLVKPIPVIVDPLGDKLFVAEVPEMDLSITGNSVGDTLILLKDHIATVYEGLRIKKNLDPERTRQLRLLEAYIGKSRRSWF
jgi:hypothetical protein